MTVVLDPQTGHVDPHQLVLHKSIRLGPFGFALNIIDQDILNAEADVEGDPKYAEVEKSVGDVLAFAGAKQWDDVAAACGKVIAEGVAIGDPEIAPAMQALEGLVKAIAARDTSASEQALISLGETLLPLLPELAVAVVKKAV